MTSFTGYSTFTRCARKYYYRYVENLEKIRDYHPAPYLGTAFHSLMEEHNHERSAWNLSVAEIDAIRNDDELYEEERTERIELWERAFDMYERYLRSPISPDVKDILHVEEEIGSSKPDFVYEDWDGFIWVVDYKTTQAMPIDLPFGNMQALMYLRDVGDLYGHDLVKGFRYHYIRSKEPAQPRLKKDGSGVAYLNTIDTTFEVLRDFLTAQAPQLLNDEDHKRRLAELREAGWFKEFVIWNTPDLRRTAEHELAAREVTISLCEQEDVWPRSFVPVGFGNCDSCTYTDLCRADWFGHDRRLVLQQYQQRAPRHTDEEK